MAGWTSCPNTDWTNCGCGGGAPPPPGAVGATPFWGNEILPTTATTRYLCPGYDTGLALTGPIQWRAPRAGTMRNLRVRHNRPGTAATVITYTLRINGVATLLAASLAALAADGADLVNAVAVASGDLVDIEITHVAYAGPPVRLIEAICEF